MTREDELAAAVRHADLVRLETPSNPLLDVVDFAEVAAAAAAGALVAMDNTFASPLLQAPLQLGADFVVHSAAKFIGGHSDLLLGAVVRRRPADGARLARRLAAHPAVGRVRHPGLPTIRTTRAPPGSCAGSGQCSAFEVRDVETADAVCARVRVIAHATSVGRVESAIERRAKLPGQDHVPAGRLRLGVGCEHVEDLWADPTAALDAAAWDAVAHPAGRQDTDAGRVP
jgi:cystathionine gamma-synthase